MSAAQISADVAAISAYFGDCYLTSLKPESSYSARSFRVQSSL